MRVLKGGNKYAAKVKPFFENPLKIHFLTLCNEVFAYNFTKFTIYVKLYGIEREYLWQQD